MDIHIQHVSKSFSLFHKQAGLWSSIKGIFYRPKTIKHALTDINVSIPSGTAVALIGPNGSGKTTLTKLMSGILTPTTGQITIGEFIPHQRKPSYLRQISLIMGQRSQLWWDIPALDSYHFLRSIYEIPRTVFDQRLAHYSKLLDIEGLITVPVRKLSLGERMRCEFLAAILHHPRVLFLDEPTIGLDIISQQTIRQFLVQYHQQEGATVILTSHNMQDIAAICQQGLLLQHGKIAFHNSLAALIDHYAKERTITIQLKPGDHLAPLAKHIKKISHPNLVVDLIVPYNEVALVTTQVLQNNTPQKLTIREPSLEEIVSQFFLDSSSQL